MYIGVLIVFLLKVDVSGGFDVDWWLRDTSTYEKIKEVRYVSNGLLNLIGNNFEVSLGYNYWFDTVGFLYNRVSLYFSDAEFSLGDLSFSHGWGLGFWFGEDEGLVLYKYLRGVYGLGKLFSDCDLYIFWGRPISYLYYEIFDTFSFYVKGIGLNYKQVGFYFMSDEESWNSGLWWNFNTEKIFLLGEWIYRRGYLREIGRETYGGGVYLSLGLKLKFLNPVFEFKDYYRLNMSYNLLPPVNDYGILLNDGENERGGSIDVGIDFKDKGKVNLNSSYSFEVLGDGKWFENNLKYEIDSKKFDIILKIGRYTTQWNKYFGVEDRKENYFHLDFLYKNFLPVQFNLKIRDRLIVDKREVLRDFGLSFFPMSNLTFGLLFQNDDEGHLSFNLSYVFKYKYRILIEYGSRRSDIICSRGVCRWEPSFDGFRLFIELKF